MKRTSARYIGLRLFLEGVEVEVIQAEVTGGINQPATAVIAIPATDEAHELLPRTLVHLFFMESAYAGEVAEHAGYAPDAAVTRRYDADQWVEFASGTTGGGDAGTIFDAAPPGETGTTQAAVGKAGRFLNKHDIRQWRLMFAGEIMGYSFSKIGGLRQIVLQCRDFSSYWEQCKMYWGGAKTSTSTYKRAIFAGATQLHRGKSKVDSTDDLLRLLRSKPSTLPGLGGLLGGIFALLESTSGVYDSRSAKKYRGVNDFMSQAELRLKLTHMIGAHPHDDTSETFIKSKAFRRYFRRITRAVKSTASFMDITQLLLTKVYHQFVSVPCPPYLTEFDKVKSRVRVPKKINVRKDSDLSDMHGKANNLRQMLGGYINRGRAAGITPASEKVDANLKKQVSRGPEPDTQATDPGYGMDSAGHDVVSHYRPAADAEPIPRVSNVTELKADPFYKIAVAKFTAPDTGNPTSQAGKRRRTAQRNARAKYLEALQRLKVVTADATGKGVTQVEVMQIAELLDEGLRSSARAAGTPYHTVYSEIGKGMGGVQRLNMFLMTPDLYMAPPPKCNVIFPEHVRSIQFNRNWMRETTRLALHGRRESGRNKKTLYFSPNSAILHNRGAKGTRKTSLDEMVEAMKRGVSFIMGHEKYTGPIAEIVGLGDNDIFKKIHKGDLKEAEKRKVPLEDITRTDGTVADFDYTEPSGQARHSPQEHMQRAANYMFFAKRFASRSLSSVLRFNPALVAGLSCLILDPGTQASRMLKYDKQEGSDADFPPTKYTVPRSQSKRLQRKNRPLGTHYIGVIESVVHTFDARGGASTSVNLSKCRQHREGIDLFRVPEDEFEEYEDLTEGDRPPLTSPYATATKIWWSSSARNAGGNTEFLSPVSGTTTGGDNPSKGNTARGYGVDFTVGAAIDTGPPQANRSFGSVDIPTAQADPIPQGGDSGRWGSAKKPSGKGRVIMRPALKDGKAQFVTLKNDDGEAKSYQVTKMVRITSRKHTANIAFSFESTTLPPWLAQIYWPSHIGTEFYAPMLGSSSILDDSIAASLGGSDEKGFLGTPGLVETTLDPEGATESASEFNYYSLPWKEVGSGGEKFIAIPRDLATTKQTVLEAVDDLAEMYLGLKQIGANMDKFIDLYTQRSYGTIQSILGNVNNGLLFMARDGMQPYLGDKAVIGFHGNAYGPHKDLKGYIAGASGSESTYGPIQPDSLARGVTTAAAPGARKVEPKIDPRKLRYKRVLQYLQSINTRALGG